MSSSPGYDGYMVRKETDEEKEQRERRIKQMAMIVCICKGIPLGRVLPAVEKSQTVAEVNRKSGCGTGGCQGQRCGPRIKKLLTMQEARRQKSHKPSDAKLAPEVPNSEGYDEPPNDELPQDDT